MAKTLRVEVTAEDIAEGARSDRHECPLAKAGQRQGLLNPAVGLYWYQCGPIDGRERYELSERAARFIEDSDNGHPVKPTTFVFRRAAA